MTQIKKYTFRSPKPNFAYVSILAGNGPILMALLQLLIRQLSV